VVASIAVAALWYLQAPPRTTGGYAERAADTAATLRSQAETARIWTEVVRDDKTLLTSAAVGLEETDTDASTALGDFEQLDPPRGGVPIRDDLTRAGDTAVTLLADLRIAAQDRDWAEVERRRDALARMGRRLEALERRLRP
jgi:hypothetical protein